MLRGVASGLVESNEMILVSSSKSVRGLVHPVARGCQRCASASVLFCDYKFLACTGRTVSSTRPSTQICDSSNSSTQLPLPKLA